MWIYKNWLLNRQINTKKSHRSYNIIKHTSAKCLPIERKIARNYNSNGSNLVTTTKSRSVMAINPYNL